MRDTAEGQYKRALLKRTREPKHRWLNECAIQRDTAMDWLMMISAWLTRTRRQQERERDFFFLLVYRPQGDRDMCMRIRAMKQTLVFFFLRGGIHNPVLLSSIYLSCRLFASTFSCLHAAPPSPPHFYLSTHTLIELSLPPDTSRAAPPCRSQTLRAP